MAGAGHYNHVVSRAFNDVIGIAAASWIVGPAGFGAEAADVNSKIMNTQVGFGMGECPGDPCGRYAYPMVVTLNAGLNTRVGKEQAAVVRFHAQLRQLLTNRF